MVVAHVITMFCNSCHVKSTISAPQNNNVPEAVKPPPQAKFVADITLTDGTIVQQGVRMLKTWRVRNTGVEKWEAGTRLVNVGGDNLGAPSNGFDVPLASPGETVNISISVTMPKIPGRYTSYWRLTTPSSNRFGHRFWITCVVVPPPETSDLLPLPSLSEEEESPAPTKNYLAWNALKYQPKGKQSLEEEEVKKKEEIKTSEAKKDEMVQALLLDDKFQLAVTQLAEFGFYDVEKVTQVVKDVNGDISQAIDKLLSMGL